MAIVLVRIDDRLIHGQIVEGWLKNIRVNHIVVISDQVAKDKMQQILLGMAAPSNIKVSNYSVDEGAQKIVDEQHREDRILLLVSSPEDVVRLLDRGVKLPSVNVGGMHYTQGKRQLLRNLSVDEDDLAALRELNRRGVELEGRVLPLDERINIVEVINAVPQDTPEK